ncbi:MAG: hypothetical protein SGJ27_31130 [Candidatus Melainabacteria bacterium]|nr:hypothetical protein [Candidatus Melainabacteria bacterium]
MVEQTPTTVHDSEWAIVMKRDASQALSETRSDLVLAEADLAAAEEAHNELFREREAARVAARFKHETPAKDADWEESASRLSPLADLLDDEYNDRWPQAATRVEPPPHRKWVQTQVARHSRSTE